MEKRKELKFHKFFAILIFCLTLSLGIGFSEGLAHAGWDSALIWACDPEGCYLEDVYVWVNGYEQCC